VRLFPQDKKDTREPPYSTQCRAQSLSPDVPGSNPNSILHILPVRMRIRHSVSGWDYEDRRSSNSIMGLLPLKKEWLMVNAKCQHYCHKCPAGEDTKRVRIRRS
jgi:hypothetical protein